jgi:signal transduction histidine kinase
LLEKISNKNFRVLSHEILDYVNKGVPKIDFLHDILKMLLDFSKCDAVELLIKEHDKFKNCIISHKNGNSFKYSMIDPYNDFYKELDIEFKTKSVIKHLKMIILKKNFDPILPIFNTYGSFCTGNLAEDINIILKTEGMGTADGWKTDFDFRSLALIPIFFIDEIIGIMQLISNKLDFFTEDDIGQYEGVARNLGIATINHDTQSALHERVKELTCLYSIAQLAEQQEFSLPDILEGIVKLLPPAWQYSEITYGRIELDGRVFSTAEYRQNGQKQIADIIINGKWRGVVEVQYFEKKPDLDEGPFLKEERSLIDAIARQIALIVERKEAEENKAMLQEQIRHADRLATIGQLGAGVAHELNEPLGNILGFAQLIKKCPSLPDIANKDIDKIINATLNAREVIKKLMLFAHQMPPKKAKIKLNEIINDGLYFFEARCAKEGIKLIRHLSPGLPEIIGDRAQLNQVLVNLVVNAIQAMPEGGNLIIKTFVENDNVNLTIEDTGAGMRKDILKKIFIPFFTTKDVDEGTGLGLAVVHGIITSHKGRIKVGSSIDIGTRFEIQFPKAGS